MLNETEQGWIEELVATYGLVETVRAVAAHAERIGMGLSDIPNRVAWLSDAHRLNTVAGRLMNGRDR